MDEFTYESGIDPTTVHPKHQWVLVRRKQLPALVGDILIPQQHRGKATEGVVVRVPATWLRDNRQMPSAVAVGDTICFCAHAGSFVGTDADGMEYILVQQQEILGKVVDAK